MFSPGNNGFGSFDNDEDESGITFRDMITLALLGFVSIVILLLPHINSPTKPTSTIELPGNINVEIKWPDKLDVDVDLWVQGPGDVPVGYSNKGGLLFNLLRDDLGNHADLDEFNYENAFSRGILPGEYTVNIHMYRNAASVWPVPVKVAVTIRSSPEHPARRVLYKEVELSHENQEVTVFRFELEKTNDSDAWIIVPSSVHNLFKELRSAASRD